MKSKIPKELIEAYLCTSYNIFHPEITITVGKIIPALDELLRKDNCNEWAFITPVNPYSEILSEVQNRKLYQQLKEALKDYEIYEGQGVGANSDWPPEASFLVAGISREDAIKTGNYYKQNAIVVGTFSNPAELILLR